VVAGPGLDGELSQDQVLAATGDEPERVLDADDVAPFAHVLDWHPTESTALLAAAAHGRRGVVEIRDGRLAVPLTDRSAQVHRVALATVLARSLVATALVGSSSLDEAEEIARRVCGFSEIDAERRKAAQIAALAVGDDTVAHDGGDEATGDASRDRRRASERLDRAVRDLEAEAGGRGVDFLTFRRIAEELQLPSGPANRLRRHLVATRPEHHAWPLWSVTPRAS
jgi:hypothetical protein